MISLACIHHPDNQARLNCHTRLVGSRSPDGQDPLNMIINAVPIPRHFTVSSITYNRIKFKSIYKCLTAIICLSGGFKTSNTRPITIATKYPRSIVLST